MNTKTLLAVVLLSSSTSAYAAEDKDESTTGLEADQNAALAPALDNPKTRLDKALLGFRKAMDERKGK